MREANPIVTENRFNSLIRNDSKKFTPLDKKDSFSMAGPRNNFASPASPRMAGSMWISKPKKEAI